MKITEINNLKIYPSKQTIDKSLGLPLPFQDKNSLYVVTGSCGTGKSTFLNSAMTSRKQDGKIFANCFEKVFYATPEECFSSEDNHPFKNHPSSRLFHTFDTTMLQDVIKQSLENKHSCGGSSILLIDDFSEELKSLATIQLLKKMMNKHRHYHLTIILSALTMKSVPKAVRGLIDYYVIFKPKGLIEMQGFIEEIFAVSKQEMIKIMDFVFDAPHNFLMFESKTNTYFKNFNKFIPNNEI